ncbi:MAG: hypothetical protein HGB00_09645 [Chlorobiaceae bacterium]|nr:hypothetical protein [Chlorobiaceae bacterium]
MTPPTVQAPAAIAVASRPDSAARKPSAVPATKPAPATKVVAAPATKPLPPATPTPAIRPDAAPRLTTQATAPKAPPVEKPVAAAARPQPQEPAKPVPTSGFTLQFGSFDSVSNANQLASQLSAENAPASVQKINGIYKVRLKNIFATRAEAVAFSRTLPIESFVVTLQP